MSGEIWRDIEGYGGNYQISNCGRVKSVAREWTVGYGSILKKDETYLRISLNTTGYYNIVLCNNGRYRNHRIHILVWEHFGNESRVGKTIDHIDENKLNNHISNLQLLTKRANTVKSKKIKSGKNYVGVRKTPYNRWQSSIVHNGKDIYLGTFITKSLAILAYEKYKLSNKLF